METFVAIYQEFAISLGLSVAEATLGIIAFLILTTVLALVNSGLKANQYAKLKAAKTGELAEKSQELESTQQRLETLSQQTVQTNAGFRQQLKELYAKKALLLSDSLDTLPDDAMPQITTSALSELATKIGLLNNQCHSYKHQIDHLELAKMATFDELNVTKQRKNKLELQLSQASLQEAWLTDKCQQLESDLATARHQQLAAEQQLASQQTEQAAKQNHIVELEENAKQAAQQLSLATSKISRLQAELETKDQQLQNNASSVAELQTDQKLNETELDQLKYTHEQTAKELGLARQKITELESQIRDFANKPTHSSSATSEPAASLAEDSSQPKQLLDNLLKTVTADFHFSKRPTETEQAKATTDPADPKALAKKDAAIEKLSAEISAQQNHIARLEREIEAIQEQAHNKALQGTDTASSLEHSSLEKKSANLVEGLLAKTNLSALNHTFEKITHLPQDMKQQWVDPVKEKLDETTDKAKQVPEQIKGLMQKLIPFK